MNLADVLGSVFGGGITGLIGVAVQRVFEYKSKQLDIKLQSEKFTHEIDLKKADAEIMAQEWAARTKIATIDSEAKQSIAETQAFNTALTSEPQRYSDPSKISPAQEWIMISLDLIKGLIRPVLTIYLCVITSIMYFESRQIVGSNPIAPDQASKILEHIIETVLYLTTTCVLFYFGSRNKERPPKI